MRFPCFSVALVFSLAAVWFVLGSVLNPNIYLPLAVGAAAYISFITGKIQAALTLQDRLEEHRRCQIDKHIGRHIRLSIMKAIEKARAHEPNESGTSLGLAVHAGPREDHSYARYHLEDGDDESDAADESKPHDHPSRSGQPPTAAGIMSIYYHVIEIFGEPRMSLETFKRLGAWSQLGLTDVQLANLFAVVDKDANGSIGPDEFNDLM